MTPLGYQQITSLSTTTALTVPADASGRKASICIISTQTQGVRWRDDGTAPTASVGYPLLVGSEMTYQGALERLKFIETSASATLNICYYGD